MKICAILLCLFVCANDTAADVPEEKASITEELKHELESRIEENILKRLETLLDEKLKGILLARLANQLANDIKGDREMELIERIKQLENIDKQRVLEISELKENLKSQQLRIDELERTMLADNTRGNGARTLNNSVTGHLGELRQQNQRIRQIENENTIAFFATLSNTVAHAGVHQTFEFDHVITNIGNAYNIHNGNFIAPVAGIYVFSVTLMSQYHENAHAQFMRNGVFVSKMYVSGTNAGYDTTSQTIVLELTKGDNVCVHNIDTDASMAGIYYSSFAGFLLQENSAIQSIIGK